MANPEMRDRKQRFAVAQILPLCSDSEMTGFVIEILNQRGFPPDTIQSLLILKESQMNNENEFQQRILKGERSEVPTQNPVIAMADSQKLQMVQMSKVISKPISDVRIDLVIGEQDNEVKGFRFQLGDQSLEQWCQENGLPFEVYQSGLQAYIEVDVLGKLDVAILNGQLVHMDTQGPGFEVISDDDIRKKINAQSNTWNEELEKRMKADHFLAKDGKVRFSIESLGKKVKKIKTLKTEEIPKPAVD